MPNQRTAESRLRELGRLPAPPRREDAEPARAEEPAPGHRVREMREASRQQAARDGPGDDGSGGFTVPDVAGSRLARAVDDLVARADPGGPGLKVLAVVAVVAALAGGGYALWSRPAPEPLPAVRPEPAARTPTVEPSVMVHVAGKVRRPGLVRLPAGARVADAIEAAGGAKGGLHTVNLARKVADGEQIAVGVAQRPDTAGPSGGPALIDLNTATAEDLQRLPGVGEVLAGRIIEYRDKRGGFRSLEQLKDVSGIGDARFADLKDKVRV